MSLDEKTLLQAIKEAKDKAEKRKFTQSMELIINLRDIDPKKPEGKIQELAELPHITETGNRVCVFASGEMTLKAKRAGADLVIEKPELEAMAGDKKSQKDLVDSYDFFIAEAPLMPLVGKVLGATLGPKGKMPTPVPPTADIAQQIKRHRKMVLLRLRGQPVIQCRIGTEKLSEKEIAENVQTVMRIIERKLQRGTKNIRSVCLKTTMGTPVKIRL